MNSILAPLASMAFFFMVFGKAKPQKAEMAWKKSFAHQTGPTNLLKVMQKLGWQRLSI